MKRLWLVVLVFVLAAFCTSVAADDVEYGHGEVIYHQNFSVLSNFSKSGIRVGTLSTPNASYVCDGEYLTVQTWDSGRAYNILPDVATGHDFTVEFSFRFTDTSHPNGYLAYMLTCRGDEPTNITPLTFRADGTIDDFSNVPAELTEAIAAGEEIYVEISVEDDVLYHIILTARGGKYTLERDSILMIAEGSMGFLYRYIGVGISEIYIVNGVDYPEKTGELTDDSYASDSAPVVTPGDGSYGEGSPTTGDMGLFSLLICTAVAGGAALILGKRILEDRKHR